MVDFSIGAKKWPGLSKLIEEAGEVQTVAGKIIGVRGKAVHFDGAYLPERLAEEIADLMAACEFVIRVNGLDEEQIADRIKHKVNLFIRWHEEQAEED